MVKNIQTFGYIATLFAIPAFIPQVIKVFKTGHTKSLSARSSLLYLIGQVFWGLNAISSDNKPLLVASIINVSCFIYIIFKMYENGDFDLTKH